MVLSGVPTDSVSVSTVKANFDWRGQRVWAAAKAPLKRRTGPMHDESVESISGTAFCGQEQLDGSKAWSYSNL